MSDHPACAMHDVQFSYRSARDRKLEVGALVIERGERVLLHGLSGSGKSTLLSLICGIYESLKGTILVDGKPMTGVLASKRDRLRADAIGYIFQSFNLVPYLSPLENVLLPATFSSARSRRAATSKAERKQHARMLLSALGVEDVARKSTQLSVGQQQRVAAARALFGSPPLLVADEPTSALDSVSRDRFLELFLGQAEQTGAGLIMVSHDRGIASLFDREIAIGDVLQWTECA